MRNSAKKANQVEIETAGLDLEQPFGVGLRIPDAYSCCLNTNQRTREESQKLVQSLFLSARDRPRSVVFAGVDHGSGCSEICGSVAEILASNTPQRVCLIEANLRSPDLQTLFDLSDRVGLAEALTANKPIKYFVKRTEQRNLWVLPAGTGCTEPSALLNSDQMKTWVAELRKEFEYLIFDAPPLKLYADAHAVAQLADGIVLVVEANATRREEAIKAAAALRSAQIKIFGAALNKRTFPIPDLIYKLL